MPKHSKVPLSGATEEEDTNRFSTSPVRYGLLLIICGAAEILLGLMTLIASLSAYISSEDRNTNSGEVQNNLYIDVPTALLAISAGLVPIAAAKTKYRAPTTARYLFITAIFLSLAFGIACAVAAVYDFRDSAKYRHAALDARAAPPTNVVINGTISTTTAPSADTAVALLASGILCIVAIGVAVSVMVLSAINLRILRPEVAWMET